MSSPFQKKFCGKTPAPIKMLGDLNKDGKMSSYEQTRQDAIEANSPTNYNSPLEQEVDSKKKQYQDSIQNLHRPAYDNYIKRQIEGYTSSQDIGSSGDTYTPPQTDPTKVKSLKDFAYAIEVGKGGSVKDSEGRTAYDLAKKYK